MSFDLECFQPAFVPSITITTKKTPDNYKLSIYVSSYVAKTAEQTS